MPDDLETLADAAKRHGYRSKTSLHIAVQRGDIAAHRWSDRVLLLDKNDVDRYVASRQRRGGRGRARRN